MSYPNARYACPEADDVAAAVLSDVLEFLDDNHAHELEEWDREYTLERERQS